jgi:hypothetical protein
LGFCHPAKGIRQIAIIKLGTFAEMPFFSFLPKLYHFFISINFFITVLPLPPKTLSFNPLDGQVIACA